MLNLERDSRIPLYEQIYNYVKNSIEQNEWKAGMRLPSVRYWAGALGVSKITVEQAYFQLLAEGYIKAHNRAPYEVVALPSMPKYSKSEFTYKKEQALPPSTYNFATGSMDPEGFDYSRWKRILGYVLRDINPLLSRGAREGEQVLREALARYIQEARGVKATADQIFIAAGTQPLLRIISSLLKGQVETVALSKPGHLEGQGIFSDHGFSVKHIAFHDKALIEELERLKADAFYCMPSHGAVQGGVMSIKERRLLLEWAVKHKAYIIEDDYDSELRYYGKPIPSLQGMDQEERVIYLGSVSKVLPPSIRLSYMVLPPALCELYEARREQYGQTASVMEQLALAEYMNRGEWARQIRRLRKHYADKSKMLCKLLSTYFGEALIPVIPESGVYIAVYLKTEASMETIIERARQEGCSVRSGSGEVSIDKEGYQPILLSFSAIRTEELEKAVQALGRAWKGL